MNDTSLPDKALVVPPRPTMSEIIAYRSAYSCGIREARRWLFQRWRSRALQALALYINHVKTVDQCRHVFAELVMIMLQDEE